MTAPAYGDILICTTILDNELVPGRIVTVAHATEDYAYFKEVPNIGYRLDTHFLLAVRRPWYAWGDEAAWEREAKRTAAALVRDLFTDGFAYRRYMEERYQSGHEQPRPRHPAALGALAALAYLSLDRF